VGWKPEDATEAEVKPDDVESGYVGNAWRVVTDLSPRVDFQWDSAGCFAGSVSMCVGRGGVPAAKLHGNGHAALAELIGEVAMSEGAGDHHTADAESGDGFGFRFSAMAFTADAAGEDADHSLEDGFEGLFCFLAAARDVAGERDHGTGVLHVFKVLAREIGAYDLRASLF
jgi:hypothetical protein